VARVHNPTEASSELMTQRVQLMPILWLPPQVGISVAEEQDERLAGLLGEMGDLEAALEVLVGLLLLQQNGL
jgi:hypothetical protein